jgi:hypothetical protein
VVLRSKSGPGAAAALLGKESPNAGKMRVLSGSAEAASFDSPE